MLGNFGKHTMAASSTTSLKLDEFLRDALAAWEEYQATGLHLTGEEADEWLERLEAGESSNAPECHG
jgi:predicted transcriptional regulator